jgi:ribosomal protein L11 methyltransferase
VTKSRNRSGADAASFVARLTADEGTARRLADIMAESLDPADTTCAAFERTDKRWQVDLHFRARPDPSRLRMLVAQACGTALAKRLSIERVAPRDWVRHSLIGLRPVTAGRFVIHGGHDRDRVPAHCIALEIEAATAFGTGHHGTTRGCLLGLDAIARQRRPRHILDLGTGSGILAIAAAKLLHRPVLASDIDPRSAAAARANARLNGVGGLVTAVQAADLRAPHIVRRAPFDLVMANILLRPLQRLAAPLARQLMPNARLVLSGILAAQEGAMVSSYRSQGLVLERSFALDGWVTLLMAARSI